MAATPLIPSRTSYRVVLFPPEGLSIALWLPSESFDSGPTRQEDEGAFVFIAKTKFHEHLEMADRTINDMALDLGDLEPFKIAERFGRRLNAMLTGILDIAARCSDNFDDAVSVINHLWSPCQRPRGFVRKDAAKAAWAVPTMNVLVPSDTAWSIIGIGTDAADSETTYAPSNQLTICQPRTRFLPHVLTD